MHHCLQTTTHNIPDCLLQPWFGSISHLWHSEMRQSKLGQVGYVLAHPLFPVTVYTESTLVYQQCLNKTYLLVLPSNSYRWTQFFISQLVWICAFTRAISGPRFSGCCSAGQPVFRLLTSQGYLSFTHSC